MQNTKRAFLSISIPQHVKEAIFQMSSQFPDVTVNPTNNFHITVKFLGDITDEQQEVIADLMQFLTTQFGPIPIAFKGFKIVEQRLRLLVQNTDTLQDLYDVVVSNLKKIDLYKDDRLEFEPHVTLGKTLQSQLPFETQSLDLSALHFNADHLTLYETVRGKGVPVFEPLEQVTFRENQPNH